MIGRFPRTAHNKQPGDRGYEQKDYHRLLNPDYAEALAESQELLRDYWLCLMVESDG